MTTQAGKMTIFGDDFQKSISASAQPEWLKSIRNRAYKSFTARGLPTVRDEEWKYTKVDEVSSGKWNNGPNGGSERAEFDLELFGVADGLKVVFIDGVLNEELTSISDVPEGIRVLSFAEAAEDEAFRARLTTIQDSEMNGFTLLNSAFIENGVFVHVAKNIKLEESIQIVFFSTSETVSFPRILYVGETGSEAEIVEMYTRTNESSNLTNSVAEILLEDNARLKHTRVQRESHSAIHIGTTQTILGRDSVYDNTNINLGGKIARHDANLEFTGEGAEAWVDGLYLIEDGQHTDTHSRIDHKVKNCVSHQTYKGILDGKSRAVFNGKVFVQKDASGTDATQSNKNLLLSNDARVDTKPQLEIFNDDVKCAHGATVGQLEGEELFYLLSRGLNEDLARNLLTYGFAEEIINKIEIESIKKDLDEAVLNRLHARLG